MNIIIYFAGLLIGVASFIYLFSLIAAGNEKIKQIKSTKPQQPVKNMNSETVSFRNRPSLPPGVRVCPLCGSELTRYEGLYASKVIDKKNAKLLIMGCRYCYKEDEDPDRRKKSMI